MNVSHGRYAMAVDDPSWHMGIHVTHHKTQPEAHQGRDLRRPSAASSPGWSLCPTGHTASLARGEGLGSPLPPDLPQQRATEGTSPAANSAGLGLGLQPPLS